MKVYFRHNDGSLGMTIVHTEDHEEAIDMVCEDLVAQEIGYNNPVLAVIK